jgi:hypothetical protein
MAGHAQRRHQVVVGFDAAALAATPIGVRGLNHVRVATKLARQFRDQAQQLFASNVGMF